MWRSEQDVNTTTLPVRCYWVSFSREYSIRYRLSNFKPSNNSLFADCHGVNSRSSKDSFEVDRGVEKGAGCGYDDVACVRRL